MRPFLAASSGWRFGLGHTLALGGGLLLSLLLAQQLVGLETATKPTDLIEIFDEQLMPSAQWQTPKAEHLNQLVRDTGGYAGKHWVHFRWREGELTISGLSIPVRQNPGPGEVRYLSFAWVKWGGGQIALEIQRDPAQDGQRRRGEIFGYRYDAGPGDPVDGKALRLADSAPGRWMEVTRDLWNDFGDFTITGLRFRATGGRDWGIDRIYLGQTMAALQQMPPSRRMEELVAIFGEDGEIATAAPILPAQVAEKVDVDEIETAAAGSESSGSTESGTVVLHSDVQGEQLSVDWGQKLKDGGAWMYPLYLLSVVLVVLTVLRLFTVRVGRFAPEGLDSAVRRALLRGDVAAALEACERQPSTLANALRFVIEHRRNDMEQVNAGASDIAARDIRDLMASIYPLSVIASLAPLLGLLGTIIGMIEAFELVSIYGDEGGATILSHSISLALITTAAGLIIAIPAVTLYFFFRNRVTAIASRVEVALESVITALYLKKDPAVAGAVLNHEQDRAIDARVEAPALK